MPEQIPVLHFSEALELVGAAPDEPDLVPEHERILGKWAKSQFGSDFLAVERYPAGNACTTMPTTLRRWPLAAKTRPTMPLTSKRWDAACPRTAGSLSA
ncbi:hypothetical protein AZG88_08090 [Rhodococcus sp. LB1]|nr:hypothetical protein AZG88_08090 [Rhodococcus sp. LB1]